MKPAQASLGDDEKWILRLLYAPLPDNRDRSVEGRTRLMKGLFLIDRKLREKFDGEKTSFNFRPYKYGPFDKAVYEALETLEEEGAVRTIQRGEYEANRIVLTEKGIDMAEEAFESLGGEERELISWVKGKHVQKSVSQLLSFVYNQYPDQAVNSELEIA